MFKSISYVIKENFSNVYRIFCIAKYELLSDMRDSKFGIFWNFASPAIQVFTYWLVFGIAWGRKAQTYRGITVEYLPWLVVAFSVWWYIEQAAMEEVQNSAAASGDKETKTVGLCHDSCRFRPHTHCFAIC